MRLDEHELALDILRNIGYSVSASPMKDTALQLLAHRLWLESKEYDYFSDVAEDIEVQVVHDIAAMQYMLIVSARVPEDIYAHYTFVEK